MRYEGHTPGDWTVIECDMGGGIIERKTAQSHLQVVPLADAVLMADAPKLLAQRDALAAALQRMLDIKGSTRGAASIVDEFRHIAGAALAMLADDVPQAVQP